MTANKFVGGAKIFGVREGAIAPYPYAATRLSLGIMVLPYSLIMTLCQCVGVVAIIDLLVAVETSHGWRNYFIDLRNTRIPAITGFDSSVAFTRAVKLLSLRRGIHDDDF